jgi:5-methylcytosine-specific restriction protein A
LRLPLAPARLQGTATAGTKFARIDGSTAAQRGYDGAWRKVRREVLAAEPLCRSCAALGQVTAATQVHHVCRFVGLDDPLRLDPTNCAPICGPCHAAESAKQSRGG